MWRVTLRATLENSELKNKELRTQNFLILKSLFAILSSSGLKCYAYG